MAPGRPIAFPARRTGVAAVLTAVLDLLLPPECLACDAPVSASGLFCAACFAATTLIADPLCARCGLPFASAGAAGRDGICPACHLAPPRFATARAALLYDAGARRLILPFKHADRPEIAIPSGAVPAPRRGRAARPGRCAGAGAAAPAPPVRPALQPGGGAGPGAGPARAAAGAGRRTAPAAPDRAARRQDGGRAGPGAGRRLRGAPRNAPRRCPGDACC